MTLVNDDVKTWTNMPAAETEYVSPNAGYTYRLKVDLTNASSARLSTFIGTNGFAGSKLKLQYSTDQAAWVDTGAEVALDAGATTLSVGSYASIPAGAKADVFLRIVGIAGNGIVDPSFSHLVIYFK